MVKKLGIFIFLVLTFSGCYIDRDTRRAIQDHIIAMSPDEFARLCSRLDPIVRHKVQALSGRSIELYNKA
jgi:hypothetical protein